MMEKETSLSDKIYKDEGSQLWGDIYEKDVREFIKKVIEEDLEMCQVCGGSHGKWLDKDDFVKRFKKRAGKKLSQKTEQGGKDGNDTE